MSPAAGELLIGLAEMTDAELLAAHCEGDPEAFGEIFRRHKDRMWAVAVRTCGDREMASDAIQDGLLAAFRRAGQYRGDAAVTTWLHRIVVNACLDRLRRRKPSGPLPEADLPDPHDHHASRGLALDVHQSLQQLPEGQRLAVVLVEMHGLPVAEAAQVLGVAEGTVTSRCARGRAVMAELLGIRRPEERPPPATPSQHDAKHPRHSPGPGPGSAGQPR